MAINSEGLHVVKNGLSVATRKVEQTFSTAASIGLKKDTLDIPKNSKIPKPAQGFWLKVKNFFGQIWDWLKGLFSTQKSKTLKSAEALKSKATSPASIASLREADKTVKEKSTEIRTECSVGQNYSHLIRIGEGSNPSPEFVAKAQKAVTEMMNSLPEALRELALKQKFGVKIYHSPHDYMKRLKAEGLEAILTENDIQDLKKRLDDMRPMIKEKLKKMFPEEEISDEYFDEIMQENEKTLKDQILDERQGSKAYYSRGYQNIILHEKLVTPNKEHIVIDPTPELFRHEIGHYFDFSRQASNRAFSSNPQFIRLLQEDLEDAYQSKNPVFSLTKNERGQLKLGESERLNLQQANIKQFQQYGISQKTIDFMKQHNPHLFEKASAEHFAYYVPVDELQPLNERKYVEAFAEIFAGLFGNGVLQKGCLAKDLYPKTAEYMRSNILPQIGALPAIQKGHNGF